ncbi:MAG: hypothetical protein AB7U52_06435 [Candidatus Izemoplasmatales bacterium]
MQQEFINNLITYINCHPVKEKHKIELIEILQKHQHIRSNFDFLYAVSSNLKNNYFDSIINILVSGLSAVNVLEGKLNADDPHWTRIRCLEKKRTSIQEIDALKMSLSVFQDTGNTVMIKRTKIAISIFESFLSDDDLTIEALSLARYHSINCHYSRKFDEEAEEYIEVPFDENEIIDVTERSLIRRDLKLYIPILEPLIETVGDLEYLASLLNYFAGYHLTSQMVLKSTAIKLYNYPLMVLWMRLDQINKSALKRSIEALLVPFSEKPNFGLDISKATNFYVKSYFYSVPILAIGGKKKMSKFHNYFNPDQYYSDFKDDPNEYNNRKVIHTSLFFNN